MSMIVNVNLSSLFLKNLLKTLSITQNECSVACEKVLGEEIAKQRIFLDRYLQDSKLCSNGRLSAPVKALYQSYRSSQKSNTRGITVFTLYRKLSSACQYVEKKGALNNAERACLEEIFHSNFLDVDECSTGLEDKTLQRILKPEASLRTEENYFKKIEFIVKTVLPKMELTPAFSKRLYRLPSTREGIARKLFTYNGKLVRFKGMEEVIEKLKCWDESENCAERLGQILEKLCCVVAVAGVGDDTDGDDSEEQLLLDEAGFHKSAHDLITSHLAMFNIEIPAASSSEFNRNIYQIISGTVYPAYINRCRNENHTPSADSWKEGFQGDKIAAGLVLHGLHMNEQMHQSFCKRLGEIAAARRWGK